MPMSPKHTQLIGCVMGNGAQTYFIHPSPNPGSSPTSVGQLKRKETYCDFKTFTKEALGKLNMPCVTETKSNVCAYPG